MMLSHSGSETRVLLFLSWYRGTSAVPNEWPSEPFRRHAVTVWHPLWRTMTTCNMGPLCSRQERICVNARVLFFFFSKRYFRRSHHLGHESEKQNTRKNLWSELHRGTRCAHQSHLNDFERPSTIAVCGLACGCIFAVELGNSSAMYGSSHEVPRTLSYSHRRDNTCYETLPSHLKNRLVGTHFENQTVC